MRWFESFTAGHATPDYVRAAVELSTPPLPAEWAWDVVWREQYQGGETRLCRVRIDRIDEYGNQEELVVVVPTRPECGHPICLHYANVTMRIPVWAVHELTLKWGSSQTTPPPPLPRVCPADAVALT